jgi:hypothetical protein
MKKYSLRYGIELTRFFFFPLPELVTQKCLCRSPLYVYRREKNSLALPSIFFFSTLKGSLLTNRKYF